MKTKIFFLSLILGLIFLSGCEQTRVKYFGGDMTIDLPRGEKFVNITWKETDIWYLTRPMRPNDFPERYIFKEQSNLGKSGTIYIQEHK